MQKGEVELKTALPDLHSSNCWSFNTNESVITANNVFKWNIFFNAALLAIGCK